MKIIVHFSRLDSGVFSGHEGDIAAAYSAPALSECEGGGIRTFHHDGKLWTTGGRFGSFFHEAADAYELIPIHRYTGPDSAPYSYEGKTVTWKNSSSGSVRKRNLSPPTAPWPNGASIFARLMKLAAISPAAERITNCCANSWRRKSGMCRPVPMFLHPAMSLPPSTSNSPGLTMTRRARGRLNSQCHPHSLICLPHPPHHRTSAWQHRRPCGGNGSNIFNPYENLANKTRRSRVQSDAFQ